MADRRTRAGIAVLALAVAVGLVNARLFPHGSYWVVFGLLLWAGVTLVARGRHWQRRKPARGSTEAGRPRARRLRPGEAYDDSAKLALLPNVPLAELWCQRLRQNGIEAFYVGRSPYGGSSVGVAPLNPGLPAELRVGKHDLERARDLFPELRQSV